MPPIATEIWYVWRVYEYVEDETTPRLLVPRSDPNRWEHDFDFLFETPEKAVEARDEEIGINEGDEGELAFIRSWVLCKTTTECVWSPDESPHV